MAERFKFTKTRIEELALPEPGARAVYYDEDVPKLALRVTPTGARTFYVVKRDGTAMTWVSLGSFPDMTVEQARKAAERILGDFARGINPAQAKRIERQKQTFGDAYEAYRALHVIPRDVRSAADIDALWGRFLGPLPDLPAKKHGRKRTKHPAGVDWSKRKLDSISAADVRALHARIGGKNQTTANRVVELISAIYNRARDHGYPGENPAAGVDPFKETERDRFILPDELPRFFQALRDDSSSDFRDFVLISLLTGARRGNVLSMRWQDIDLDSATWKIGRTKNDEPLFVALVPEAVQVLRKRGPKDEGFVFPAASATGYATPPKKRWRALLKRAQMKDFRIHDLRRSLGSWQAIQGASLTIIGKSLGHKSPEATAIYARLHLDPVRASLVSATTAMLHAAGVKKTDGKPRRIRRAP